MKNYAKRGLSVVLALTMGTMLFTGCGKKKTDEESILNEATKASKDYVFASEVLNITEDPSGINGIIPLGDRLCATSYGEDGEIELISFNADGSDIEKTNIKVGENENYSYYTFDSEGNMYAICNIYTWSDYYEGDAEGLEDLQDGSLEDGDSENQSENESDKESADNSGDASEKTDDKDTEDKEAENKDTESADGANEGAESDDVTVTEEDTDSEDISAPEKDECYLVKFDKDGNLLEKIDLMEKYANDGYVSISGMTATDDGTILISLEQGILSYTSADGFKMLVDNGTQYRYYQMYKGFNGKIFLSSYGDKGIELSSFDPGTGAIGEPSKTLQSYGDYSFFGGNGYDLYMSNAEGIYGYDQAADTMTKLLDYVDSDLELNGSVGQAVAISDSEFVALIPDSDYNYYVAHLTKVAPEDVKDKQLITLGGYYIDYEIRKKAFEFNRNSNEYKIKFVDYSSYDTDDNYGAGADKLNMDIVSGNTPDILILGDEMPVDSYINKGLFLDLASFISNDSEISESDFITNIFDAFKTGDKVYQIVPSFYISSMIAKSKFVEGKDVLTFKDCDELIKNTGVKRDNAFGMMLTRDGFLEQGIAYSGNSYIDWEKKQCNFNSDSFIEFLEFAKDFPTEYPESAWEDYKDTMYLNDESLFNFIVFSEFSDYAYYKRAVFGDDFKFVGFPNNLGINNSIIYPSKRMAISSQTKSKDACWEFLRAFLTEAYQDEVTYSFPIRKSSFDKKAQKAKERPYYMDGDEKIEYDETFYVNGQEIVLDPLNDDEILDFSNFIKSLNLTYTYNKNVNNIIFEEASAFFSGQKTAKEVADIIQSRLSIYVNENS
ncbi:ABC transporter substrate-binding protein [Butyrivibrio sp. YAB3001]|uniref:ABC transporter substrate-binding protein n=1 Tax=Butyrivibrio sp. YAB3001 TaxID=1520812 RepID=UPI0008F679F5|nr:extracellular solute-binding protein [Butyrivibrio sp. YAB3001]SFC36949.1 ABC-type glycerol-3-phosphate transport system, substrate-binding protein [Butyrivibrio sp. YAB3001]